jgi:hypothetical protein
VHTVAPLELTYLPVAHAVQEAPLAAEKVPGAQAEQTVAPEAEIVPAGHTAHAVLPEPALNDPGAHAAHVSQYESGPVYPALQVFIAVQPAIEFPVPQVPCCQ